MRELHLLEKLGSLQTDLFGVTNDKLSFGENELNILPLLFQLDIFDKI